MFCRARHCNLCLRPSMRMSALRQLIHALALHPPAVPSISPKANTAAHYGTKAKSINLKLNTVIVIPEVCIRRRTKPALISIPITKSRKYEKTM